MISFFVEGHPVAQPRPRPDTRGGKPRIYTPSTKGLKAWRNALMVEARLLRRTEVPETLDGPLMVALSFTIGRPKSHLTKKGNLRKSAPKHHVQKPDIDNLIKPVLDVLTRAGIWVDDTHVVICYAVKGWDDGGYREGAHIQIWEVE
jgi:Holliday junction resolvase RusA-like endonuclease